MLHFDRSSLDEGKQKRAKGLAYDNGRSSPAWFIGQEKGWFAAITDEPTNTPSFLALLIFLVAKCTFPQWARKDYGCFFGIGMERSEAPFFLSHLHNC